MITSNKYIPFVGLTYDGVHSSELGLYRVSDGSRYNDNLLPSFSDKTLERPFTDGMYYFGANYQQKDWSIEFAFDHITEAQLRKIKQLLGKGSKIPLKLIFDEDRDYSKLDNEEINNNIEIYHNHMLSSGISSESFETEDEENFPELKYYMAKVANPPELKTLCFEENGEDIYKGELTVNFLSYTPYGYGKLNCESTFLNKGFSSAKFISSTLNNGDVEVYPLIFITNQFTTTEDKFLCVDWDANKDNIKCESGTSLYLGYEEIQVESTAGGQNLFSISNVDLKRCDKLEITMSGGFGNKQRGISLKIVDANEELISSYQLNITDNYITSQVKIPDTADTRKKNVKLIFMTHTDNGKAVNISITDIYGIGVSEDAVSSVFTEDVIISSFSIEDPKDDTNALYIKDLTIPRNSYGVIIDFEKGLINGLISKVRISEKNTGDITYTKDNIIYNNCITAGTFFAIPTSLAGVNEAYNISWDTNSDAQIIIATRQKLY